ncbi:helix-turn-helix domain-containing protein [Ruegeria sp. 2205SS24-7]|uniref:helix-turn-helix domain-containing protein n=1 Tax=Ruegeria discodermiae TaxID=3064389 RepID=UPI002740E006|nr:helix-turn-helix domain-containing protein [Ruegeria sp. 2205SS24-7]MDP5221030.1 helix-turn-helix domain-containing protein [Ruegeria sp. 2205SS24-7]
MTSAPDIYKICPPPPAVAPFVERFLYADINYNVDYQIRPFPTGRCFIGFVFRDPISSQRAAQRTSATGFHFCGQVGEDDINVRYSGEIGHIMAELKPSAMLRLFGLPASEINGLSVDVRDFLPRRAVQRMFDHIAAARNQAARIAAFSRMLLDQLRTQPDRRSIVDTIAAEIDRTHGQIKVRDLAEQFEISQRTLTRQFTETVGLAPKRYASVARLNNTIRYLNAGPNPTLAKVAADTGYYDEAHMSHDFTRYFGMSPARFIEARNAMVISYAGAKPQDSPESLSPGSRFALD